MCQWDTHEQQVWKTKKDLFLIYKSMMMYIIYEEGSKQKSGPSEKNMPLTVASLTMMNGGRNGRESLYGSINHNRRSNTFNHSNAVSNHNHHDDNSLDLFSNNRRSLSLPSSDDSSDVSVKLGRLSVGAAKPARNGIEDMLSSVEGGKHDYDWLLTPPGTPVFPSSESESQSTLAPPRRSLSRSTSTTKASRLSVSQSESNNHSSRPARSSSVTRPSVSASHSQYTNNNYSSNRSNSTNILNTSSASVSSYIRPSSPVTRSTSSTRPSTPTSRPTASRSSTPSRIRSVSTSSAVEKPRPTSQSSRPSTPSSRPQVPANLHSPSAPSTRSLSRPSTPTRRSSIPSLSPSSTISSSISAGRPSLNGRSSAPSSRASSPSPRVRAPPQPVVPPDFPLDTPPNLRTTLPDRPLSAGRSRPGAGTLKGNNSEPQASVNIPRRHSSPIVSRGRSTEPVSKSRGFANGHHTDVPEPRKVSHAPEVVARRSVKASITAPDNSGFGRTISKKSLDMAIKHMDIRNGSGNRALSSTTLFPQSIRNSTPKSQSYRGSSAPPTSIEVNNRNLLNKNNGTHFDVVNGINRNMIKGREIDERQYSAKLSEIDIYESSRYDALLLKEDLKNTNWLHSADDKIDQGSLLFDNGFENLPEPFGLL